MLGNRSLGSKSAQGTRLTSRRRDWTVWGYVFVAPFFIVFLVFHLYPILYSLYLSLARWDGFSEPVFVGAANYRRLLADSFFYKSLANTLIIWTISIVPQLTLALTLALILHQRFIRGRHYFRAIFYFPNIVTPVTLGVLFSLMFDWQTGTVNRLLMALGLTGEPINWLNSPLLSRGLVGAVTCFQWFGYNMLLYIAGLQSIPDELHEAAEVDGATPVQVATKITIPLLRPVITFTVITSIIGGMQLFDVPLMLTGRGPEDSTLTMVMYLYETAFTSFDYGYGATIAYAAFVLIAILSLVAFRLTNRSE
ncbi:MAG: sugar ABC transporter permease [Chloroflexota bacterium]|nr:sugar ABC transporter permease [Chloroflexota bacterium]